MNIAEILQTQIGYMNKVTDHQSSPAQLGPVLDTIKTEYFATKVNAVRDAVNSGADDQTIKNLKLELPAMFTCGILDGSHKNENLQAHTGLVVLDYDHLDEQQFNDMWNVAVNSEFVISAFLSPSGTGLKVLVGTDPVPAKTSRFARQAYEQASQQLFNINSDTSAQKLVQATYISSDKDMYIRDPE